MILPVDIIRLAISVLRERKLRAALTIIGIAIGPAAMVAIIGTVQAYSQTIVGQLSKLGQNNIAIFSTSKYTLTDNDIRYIKRLPGVYDAQPFYSVRGVYKRSDGEEIKVAIFATDVSYIFKAIGSLKIEEGSPPPAGACTSGMVGHDIVYNKDGKRILRLGQAISIQVPVVIGDKIEYRYKTIRIVCILKKYGNALIVNPDTTIFLPKIAGKSLLKLNKYTGVLVTARDASYVDKLTKILSKKYKGLADIYSFQSIANTINSVVATLNFQLFALSMSAFAVAVTGIMATMFTSVTERTREIGVLKAMGFTSLDVLIIITSEAVIMSLIGGAIGVTAGAIGAYILTSSSFKIGEHIVITAGPAITPFLIGESIGLAIIIGVVGGLIPAYRASRVPPVRALRYE